MADKSALWVFQNLYEPKLVENGKWVVHYKSQHDNAWKSETFNTHEEAYNMYYAKYKELKVYYNTFLREIGMRK